MRAGVMNDTPAQRPTPWGWMLAATLLGLEMKGAVLALPGKRYRVV